MILGGITSKRKIQKWSEDAEIVKVRLWNLSENLYKIFSNKIGSDCVVIASTASFMFEIIAKSMPYEVIIVSPKEWDTFTGITTTKKKIYTGWFDSNPLMNWSNKGIIKSDDYIMLMGKDKNFNNLKSKHHMIDVWMNVEGYLGLAFEGCNKYHIIAMMYMGVEDDTIEFTITKNDCNCGFHSNVFTWKEKA